MNRSAVARALNATVSIRSTGGSRSSMTVNSTGGRRPPTGRSSTSTGLPVAHAPSGPKRASTSRAGNAAKAPSVRNPSRVSRSTKGESPDGSSALIGKSARNSEEPPGGTTTPARAACSAANDPSATPIETSLAPGSSLTDRDSACSTAVSLPKYRVGPRTPIAASPGRVTSTPGAIDSSATTTGSKMRASAASSRGSTASSGQRDCASRRRIPRRTPADRAAWEQATTRLPVTTAAGPWSAEARTPAAARAAVTGQSGHQTAIIRGGMAVIRPSPWAT